ncbi:perforin-1-like [Brachyistius frenatus]|uniref:perforin-1-like n=1 Tax=Brachyistius frenatus TaxID=100188 RepID=UPI0037E78912
MASVLPLLLLVLGAVGVAQSNLQVYSLRANRLRPHALPVNAYVKVFGGHRHLGQTETLDNNPNPRWSGSFSSSGVQQKEVLRLEVYSSDSSSNDLLGVCHQSVRLGTHGQSCSLRKGGSLLYVYTLS